MKNLLLFTALALVLTAAFSSGASALPGCCCTPITHEGRLVADQAECLAPDTFTEKLPNATHPACNEVCEAEFLPPPVVLPPADCNNALFAPAPVNVDVRAVKGKKQLRVSFDIPCPAFSANISRCAGEFCEEYALVAQAAAPSPRVVFYDTGADLEWNTDYSYEIVANYVKSGASEPGYADGNAGDVECWNRFGTQQFCIAQHTYDSFATYLKNYGYRDMPPETFAAAFDTTVQSEFGDKFGKAWYCDTFNNLGATATACAGSAQCIVDENGPRCVTPSLCAQGGLFGLFSSTDDCEGSVVLGTSKYCFFDRSHTSVDKCYTCNPRMTCADYRSRSACERDNCGAGSCAWRDTLPDIGIGMCIDTRFANCPWCASNGTPNLENNEAFNEVFDQCTERKAAALSQDEFPCTFNKNAQESNSCDSTACMDYTNASCAAPEGGIILNPDNSLETFSTDVCGIRVCDTLGELGCTKNADGDGEEDCDPLGPDRRVCELDHFPPETTLVPESAAAGRMDWLRARMLDKVNGTEDGEYRQDTQGYRLRVCVVAPGRACTAAGSFAETNLSSLNFNDLNLQAGRTMLASMTAGPNTLRYYGIDNHSNPEIIKEMTILACDRCQGPKVLELSVTPGKEIAGIFYTIADLPVITASFNEQATLVSAVLEKDGKILPLTATPATGASFDFRFVPLRPLDDGTYTLTFNAKDSNGRLMDSPGALVLVVDTTPGTVTIVPEDGAVLEETTVTIAFSFTEPLTLIEAVVENENWITPYAAQKENIDLLPLLTADETGTLYTATLTLTGGKKNIRVRAEDFAGNPTIGKSSFWIDSGPLQIRLREPSWGVSSTNTFDIIVDTTRTAECRYLYNTPTAPPSNSFELMPSFAQTTGVTHTVPGFNKIPAGDLTPHKLHVYCKLDDLIVVQSFALRVDPSAPIIKSAFAQPKVIIERRIPNRDIFTTTLKVQTDDEGFCKYSTQNIPFVLMEGVFSGFDLYPKKSHDAELNVTEQKAYTYFVACKNTAETPSVTAQVDFSVDLSVAFGARSLTPPYSNSTEFSLQVETNKRAFCYVGDIPEAILTCMGACDYGYAHVHPVEAEENGNRTWHVRCSTATGDEVVSLKIPVIVDTTPPVMEEVDDSSNLPNDPEYSYFTDQLQVAFFGRDDETAVNAFYYRIKSFFANDTVKNWTLSTNTNGTAFFVTGLNLTDGNKYKVEAYAVNVVGLRSAAMGSNGVTIDVEKRPDSCHDGEPSVDEADLDCGGICPGCLDGSVCAANTDCASGFCDGGVCSVAGCDDSVKNGNETDADCGGGVCTACALAKACVQNTDCASGTCSYGACAEPDPCADGILTGTETGIDCGGACATKCADGDNCKATTDCASGLLCLDSTCQPERDTDGDGVKDDVDQCANTPQDEVPDAAGCSASQKRTCGDEIPDSWRIRNFGSVLCDGDGSSGADPDKDTLTNSEEYAARTDPTQPDTDFDGWDDKEEMDKGTNPRDPEDHPPSAVRILLWMLLVLLIIAVLGFAGYMGYNYYLDRMAEQARPARPTAAAPSRPAVVRKPMPSVIDKLRGIARREEPGVMDRNWISLSEFSERLKKEKVPLKEDTFGRLKDLLGGKLPKAEAGSVLAAIRKEPEAFKLLRRITFEKLTPAEKAVVRARIAQLGAGKLTSAELEDLLAKLRVTAAYYRAHKEELEKELKEWIKK